MLTDPTLEGVFTASALLGEIIPSLLANAHEDPGMVMELLPLASGDEELTLLTSLHPEFRSAAWMLAVPTTLSEKARMMRLLALPQSDVLPEGIPGFVIQRWGLALREELLKQEDPLVLFRELLAVLHPLLGRAQEQGYPERVQNYVRVLAMAASLLELPPDLAHEVGSLEKLVEIIPKAKTAERAIDVTLQASSPEIPTIPPISPEEVEARASRALLDAGALFTVNTRIRATSPGIAKVDSIVFPSSAGDRILDFELDVLRGEVRSISDSGRFLPYAVPLSAFAAWVRGS
jgi:hypothetical protein